LGRKWKKIGKKSAAGSARRIGFLSAEDHFFIGGGLWSLLDAQRCIKLVF